MSSKNLQQDVGNISRTASAFKSSTSALTSTLTYAVPHLAGAIDILAVLQPDGDIKTSPFYVRFGKYSSLREKDRRVRISVNDIPQTYTMQVGRTGEAYFVEEKEEILPEEGEEDNEGLNAAILAGIETPPNGSSDEDTPRTEEEEFRSPFKKSNQSQASDVKRSASEPALATLGLKDASISSSSNSKVVANGTSSNLPPKAPTPHPKPPAAPKTRHLEYSGMDSDVQAAAEDAAEHVRLGEAPEQAAAEAVAAVDQEVEENNTAATAIEPAALSNTTAAAATDTEPAADTETPAKPAAPTQQQAAIETSDEVEETSEKTEIEEVEEVGDKEDKEEKPPSPIVSLASSPRDVNLSHEGSTATPAGNNLQHNQHHTGVEPSVLSYALTDLVAASPRVAGLEGAVNINNSDTAAGTGTGTGGGTGTGTGTKDLQNTSAPPPLDLSLCWHVLTEQKEKETLSPEQVAATFLEHKVTAEAFQTDPAGILSDPHLACRLGNKVYSFKDAQVLVLASLAYGPAAAVGVAPPETIAFDIAAQSLDSSEGSPVEGSTPRSSSWRGWLSFSWRSRGEDSISSSRGAGGEGAGGAGEGGGGGASSVPRSSSAQDVVPPDQEAALLTAAAEGQASHVEVTEVGGVRRSPSGRRTVLLRKRGFVPAFEHLPELAAALHPGQNDVEFSFGRHKLRAFIYLVRWDKRLVISDVDGTITKSDVLGHLGHVLGFDWTHSGVTGLFAAVARNGYGLLFLSSRSIAQASITRDYLHSLKQDGLSMPHGPVIISPDGLFPSLYREVVLRRPEEFKIRALADIKSLFPPEWNPFVAGFGNRDTDIQSYLAVGVPASRIFIINPKGELRKPSSAVMTSSLRSLPALTDLVDSLFPAIHPAHDEHVMHHGGGYKDNGTGAEYGFGHGNERRSERGTRPGSSSGGGGGGRHGGDIAGSSSSRAVGGGAGEGREGAEGGDASAPQRRYFREDTPVREEYNNFNYWKIQPSYVVDDDDLFEDAVCGGPEEEKEEEEEKDVACEASCSGEDTKADGAKANGGGGGVGGSGGGGGGDGAVPSESGGETQEVA